MKIAIYQIDNLKDENRVKFMNHDAIIQQYPGDGIPGHIYYKVWEGEVRDDATLEDIYYWFNMDHPEDFRGHSLSVSDVVELPGGLHFCDSIGWKPVVWAGGTAPDAPQDEAQPATLTGVLLDVYADKVDVVTIPASVEAYCKVLDCEIFQSVDRMIGTNRSHRRFEILCDDEATFRQDCRISAINNMGEVMMVGNLFIVKADAETGSYVSLSESDQQFILNRIQHMSTRQHLKGYQMLTQCEY